MVSRVFLPAFGASFHYLPHFLLNIYITWKWGRRHVDPCILWNTFSTIINEIYSSISRSLAGILLCPNTILSKCVNVSKINFNLNLGCQWANRISLCIIMDNKSWSDNIWESVFTWMRAARGCFNVLINYDLLKVKTGVIFTNTDGIIQQSDSSCFIISPSREEPQKC